MVTETRRTTCNRDCPDACSILATVEDGRITRLQGDRDHPVTHGFLCYRTSHFLERQYAPERLTTPLLRVDGVLRQVGWEQALDVAAQRLLAIRAESGPAAIFYYRSGGTLGLLSLLTDRFFEHLGPVTTKRGDICSGAADAAQLMDFGDEDSHDVFDLLNAKNILLWGKNPFIGGPHLVPILREACTRGARVVLVDPVHHQAATLAEKHVQVAPGGDFALAMAVGAVLFDQGWVDPAAPSYCDHLEDYRALCQRMPVNEWCALAGVSVVDAVDLARRLGPGKPTATLIGWGMGRRANGGAIARALDALAAVSGNLGIPGGGASFYFKRRGAFDTSFLRGQAAAPRTLCEPVLAREITEAHDPPVRAVWITAGNPVTMLPDSHATAAALRSREWVVVVDSFLTDTAACAHLVLPTTTLLESDDIMGAYGHHWLGVSRPVVPPPAGVKSDLEIMQGLAARTGLTHVMEGDARAWKERLVAGTLARAGVTLADLEQRAVRNPAAPRVLYADRRFPTKTGRVNLLRELPGAPWPPPPPADRPLFLMALSTQDSQSSQWVRPAAVPLEATVHPDAAAGVAHGGTARLVGERGAMTVTVRHDPAQRRDVVLVAKGGHLQDGRCANALIPAQLTDLGEGGALYDSRVRLEALP